MSLLLCLLCSFYLKKYVLLFFCLKTTPRRYGISGMSASIYATDFVRSVKCQPGELTPPLFKRNMERHSETFGNALQLFDGGVILSATNLVQVLFGPA